MFVQGLEERFIAGGEELAPFACLGISVQIGSAKLAFHFLSLYVDPICFPFDKVVLVLDSMLKSRFVVAQL